MARLAFGARAIFKTQRALPAARASASERNPVWGPGWYESSHELRRGLRVLEGLPSDTALEDWLALWLATASNANEMALAA